ncbi:MAG TPA: DUF1801 domain-containing protein [Phycisphaerae bacterium]|nr:DUF1801 domain-containing protein [Phycisphaerae bacterium]
MARQAHKKFTLVQILADYPDQVCDVAMELREFVVGVVPQARETVRWRGIAYTRPEEKKFVKGDICSITLHGDHVELAFIHGSFLPDPEGLLEADTGRLYKRYVKVHTSRDIRRAAFKKLILASLECKPWESLGE